MLIGDDSASQTASSGESNPRASSRVRRPQTWATRTGEPWSPPSGDESPACVACRHGVAQARVLCMHSSHVHTHAGLLTRSDTQTLTPTLTPAHLHTHLAHRGRSRIGCTRGFKRRPEGGWNDVILTEHMWLGQVVSLDRCAQCRPTEGTLHRTHLRLPCSEAPEHALSPGEHRLCGDFGFSIGYQHCGFARKLNEYTQTSKINSECSNNTWVSRP